MKRRERRWHFDFVPAAAPSRFQRIRLGCCLVALVAAALLVSLPAAAGGAPRQRDRVGLRRRPRQQPVQHPERGDERGNRDRVGWGCRPPNDFGQCDVPGAASSGVVAIAASDDHSLVLRQDGSVVAWGCRSNGNFTPNFGQCAVPGAAEGGVVAIAVSYSSSLALKQDGSVIAWGCDIGLDVGNCAVPAAAGDGVGAIAAGTRQGLALFPLLAQTITVTGHAPTAATYKQSFTVAATSSSGLPVGFTSSGACSNSGATFTMTSGTGTCLVRYDQAGDGPYNAAPQVIESVAAQKAGQTIDFRPLPRKTYGDPDFRVTARASSGLTVAFAARGKSRVRR